MSIPTLGYKSRTDAVLALRADGVRDVEIGKRLGIPTKTVAALACTARHRRSGCDGKPGPASEYRTVLVDREALESHRPHAERRHVHENELVRRLVETIVQSGLVDAVLDDADEAVA